MFCVTGSLEEEVMQLFKRCNSADLQKWIIRIMLKDLHLGIGHKSTLNILHPDGYEVYSNTNDLAQVFILIQ